MNTTNRYKASTINFCFHSCILHTPSWIGEDSRER